MGLDSRFAVNTPNVIHDTIDGVSVVINLASGRYYSLQNTATEIWSLVEGGLPAQKVVQRMSDRYGAADIDMRQVVQGFLEQLLQEGLVRVHDADEAPERPVPDALLAELTAIPQAPFAVPVLEIYRDLEDLLLLDPIHEVGEEGWPVAKPAGSDTD